MLRVVAAGDVDPGGLGLQHQLPDDGREPDVQDIGAAATTVSKCPCSMMVVTGTA